MANIIKVTTTKPLPEDAKIVSHKGEKCVRMKIRGRTVHFALTECGSKYRHESAKWYVQYKDEHGKWQRKPGYTDKDATLQMAADIEKTVAQRMSGLIASEGDHGKLNLGEHLERFRSFLLAKNNSAKYVKLTCNRIKRLIDGCEFERWSDIDADKVVAWLSEQRASDKMGIKTSNYYLAAVKEFVTWLGKSSGENPLSSLSPLNPSTDVRWQRRCLSSDAFTRLIDAAIVGPPIQCVQGVDRAMLYILASWTGFRRGELASLSRRSFDLAGDPATVEVTAAYSKRRKKDAIPLHPEVVERLQQWLETKRDVDSREPVFNLETEGGNLRRTSKMMKLDLEAARAKWIAEADEGSEEQKNRKESDFLCYQDEDGMYADFHANRHIFISSLSRAGIGPKMAQTLARHSDVNLTMNLYTHVGMSDQATAINILPTPPMLEPLDGDAGRSFAQGFAKESALEGTDSQSESRADDDGADAEKADDSQKPMPEQELGTVCQPLAVTDRNSGRGTRTPDTRIMIPLL